MNLECIHNIPIWPVLFLSCLHIAFSPGARESLISILQYNVWLYGFRNEKGNAENKLEPSPWGRVLISEYLLVFSWSWSEQYQDFLGDKSPFVFLNLMSERREGISRGLYPSWRIPLRAKKRASSPCLTMKLLPAEALTRNELPA